jgi:DNA polymerase-3 subunit gamma/tau
VLAEIMSLLHQIALTQFVPDACKLETISARAIFQLAKSVPAEQVQLLYQIALTGKKDLPHAADARTGLEMTLLRMLAFCPDNLKMDSLDIVALTPEVDERSQQAAIQEISQTSDHVNSGPVVTEPTAHFADDMAHQNQPLFEPVEERLDQNSSVAAVIAENQSPVQQDVSADSLPELSTELPPEISPLPLQQQTEVSDDVQTTASDADLFAQQQDIMAQAVDFGHHQPIDYDQYQPVALDERPHQAFDVENEPINNENPRMHTQPTEQPTDTKPTTSTADLIALRNKLKQSQRDGGEGAEQVKKSESAEPFNLALIRKQNQEAANQPAATHDDKQSQDIPTAFAPVPQLQVTPSSADHIIDNSPPWPVENESQSTAVVSPMPSAELLPLLTPEPSPLVSSPFSVEKTLQEAEYFDSSVHLDEDNVGEVTQEISAFLPNKQKVLKALQIDGWSQLIEDIQVTALTKQLALHSSFNQQGNTVKLTLLDTKVHLISDTAQQQLKEALCLALNSPIELEIELGQPINTPYALQLKVNQVRHEYAREVVKSDLGIQLLQQQFAAKVDEQSIQAR